MIETSSVSPRKSSATFRNLRQSSKSVRKMFGTVHQTFGTILENPRKTSESGRKSSENRQKLVRLSNKQNITRPLVDMNFIFSCSTRYLTRSLLSLVRYREDKIHIHAQACNILYILIALVISTCEHFKNAVFAMLTVG